MKAINVAEQDPVGDVAERERAKREEGGKAKKDSVKLWKEHLYKKEREKTAQGWS